MPLEEISEQKEEFPCQWCFTSSSLARVRKEDAKRASLLENSSLEGKDGSVFKEKEGSLREEDREASLRCLSLRFRSLEMRHIAVVHMQFIFPYFIRSLHWCVLQNIQNHLKENDLPDIHLSTSILD